MSSIAKKMLMNLHHGTLVQINDKKVDDFIKYLSEQHYGDEPFNWVDPRYWLEPTNDREIISQYFTLGNSINFRYWWLDNKGGFRYLNEKKGGYQVHGANYMWRSLKTCIEDDVYPILDAKLLSKISLNDIKKIFQDDQGNNIMPDLEERHRNWMDLGEKLYEYWDGEYYNVIKASNKSAFNLMQYSRQFRAFDDPLAKMIMVNGLMHKGRGISNFDDLIPGIDYQLLKQEMRSGILKLNENLVEKITKYKLIDSYEARELRNAGLYAFLAMMEKTGIEGDILDNLFWMNRNYCTNDSPNCGECKFKDICNKKVKYKIPLEKTRYY